MNTTVNKICLNKLISSVVRGSRGEDVSAFKSVLRLNESVSHPVVMHGLAVSESHGTDSLSSHVASSRASSENGPFLESELSVLEVSEHAGVHGTSSSGSTNSKTELEHKGDAATFSLEESGLAHEVSIGLLDNLISGIVVGVSDLVVSVEVGVDDS